MECILQKFGGTSVQTKNSRLICISKIKESIYNGNKTVVVISAIGRKNDPYSTDELLSLVSENFKKNNPLYLDKLISCGEIISSIVFTSELQSNNVNALPLIGQDIGILTDNNFGNAKILNIDTSNIEKLLSENIIPVIAGFQGVTSDGNITTLGRGGSDISAVKLATALNCDRVEFFKDVDGLMTADPKLVSKAKSIEEISYEELFELSSYGNNIIHPEAVKVAMDENIPIIIKNTFNSFKGTVINNNISKDEDYFKGMTYLKDCIQIKIFKNENLNNENYYKVFQKIFDENINIDFINIFVDHKVFTIYKDDFEDIKTILNDYEIKYEIIRACSKIGIVKANLKKISITIARLIELLHREGIDVLQTNHSNMSIWILVKNSDLEESLNIIHENFFDKK
ncbi:MAG TPA: aspartate kinase [Candidatus Dwaynia gallinarum]|nr:aspartate kinase [Candidatus Dwaynia gallinarum]